MEGSVADTDHENTLNPVHEKAKMSSRFLMKAGSIVSADSPDSDSERRDWNSFLSATRVSNKEHDQEEEDEEHVSYPILLLLCVSILAMIFGLIVSAFHYAIKYVGCPLGINGCNDSAKGFLLLRAVRDVTNGAVPEDLVYILVATLGALAIACLQSRLGAHSRFQLAGGGTVQSLMAVARGKPIRFRCAVLRFIVTSVYLGAAGTLGAEGPAIQVCTSLAGSIGWVLGMRAPATQSLLATLGFASGFAASFNSPLAGIIFAMEELGHVTKFVSKNIIVVILLASVAATAAGRATHGKWQLLEPNWDEEILTSSDGGSIDKVFGQSLWMLVAIPVAMMCSLAGWAITWAIRKIHTEISTKQDWPLWLPFVASCFVSACIGCVCFRTTGLRGVWGIGNESMQEAFESDFHGWEYLIFAMCKALAMIVSVAARAPGDVLEPILISGGFLGGLFGYILEKLVQDPELAQIVGKPCLVFGMVGLFSSCFRFPLTPVVITLELMGIDTYALVLPTVLCSFTAITMSNKLFPRPLLDDLLAQDGINLHALSQQAVIKELHYEEALEAQEQQETQHAALAGDGCPSTSSSAFWGAIPGLGNLAAVSGPAQSDAGSGAPTQFSEIHHEEQNHGRASVSPSQATNGIRKQRMSVLQSTSFFGDIEQSMRKLAKCVEVSLDDVPSQHIVRHKAPQSPSSDDSVEEEDDMDLVAERGSSASSAGQWPPLTGPSHRASVMSSASSTTKVASRRVSLVSNMSISSSASSASSDQRRLRALKQHQASKSIDHLHPVPLSSTSPPAWLSDLHHAGPTNMSVRSSLASVAEDAGSEGCSNNSNTLATLPGQLGVSVPGGCGGTIEGNTAGRRSRPHEHSDLPDADAAGGGGRVNHTNTLS